MKTGIQKSADIHRLYRRMMNLHFTMAADEYRDNPSYSSLKKHADEFRTAEQEFMAELNQLSEPAAENARLKASNAELVEALEGVIDYATRLDRERNGHQACEPECVQQARTAIKQIRP